MKHWKLGALVIASSLTLLAGCKEQEKVAVAMDEISSFELIQNRIFTPTCATQGCHSSEQDNDFKQHGLVLAKGKSYANLIDILSRQPEAKAEGMKRVKSYNSNESLLYHKLNWDASHHSGKEFGLPMPLGGTPLSVGQIEFVRRWIEAGSPEKGSLVDTTLLNDKTPSYLASFAGLKPPTVGEDYQMKLGHSR